MILDLMVWAPSRDAFIAGMLANNLMVQTEDGPVAGPDISIDEIGPVVGAPAVYDEDGEEVTPAVMVDGYHVNLRAYGQFALQVTHQLPQTDAEGNLLSIFDRTWLLNLVNDLSWSQLSGDGVPAGWVGPNGVKLFDPSAVTTPRRVWA